MEKTQLDLDEKSFAHVISYLSLRDSIALAATSTQMHDIVWKLLWAILPKLLRKNRFENNLCLLKEFLAFNPSLDELNFYDIGRILACTRNTLTSVIEGNIDAAWKLAAICGKESVVEKMLGNSIHQIQDLNGRGVMAFYALGGQKTCLQNFIQQHHTPFDWKKIDPKIMLARMAVMGGHDKLLEYLQKELHYDFNVIFNEEEDLLTLATEIGHVTCIEFLIQFGLSQQGLMYFAIKGGNWKLMERFRQTIATDHLLYFTKQACLHGNLQFALELINNPENTIKVEDLVESVIEGGHAEVFWHFIQQGWLQISRKDFRDATILHKLAYKGHLHLICDILQDPKCVISLYDLDKKGNSVLHYAAQGNRWAVFKKLRKMDTENKLSFVNHKGFTVAHAAARRSAVCFLLRLEIHYPKLLKEKSRNNSTILHSAGYWLDPQIPKMIIEKFAIDPLAQNDKGETFIHKTAKQATKFAYYWPALKRNLNFFGKQFLDIPNAAGVTVRQIIRENNMENEFQDILENPKI